MIYIHALWHEHLISYTINMICYTFRPSRMNEVIIDGMLYGDMFDMIKDAYPQVVRGRESSGNEPQERNGDAKKFYRLLEEVKQPLYPDCEKYSSLSSHI